MINDVPYNVTVQSASLTLSFEFFSFSESKLNS